MTLMDKLCLLTLGGIAMIVVIWLGAIIRYVVLVS